MKARLLFTDFDDLKAQTTAWSPADYAAFLLGFDRLKALIERDRHLFVRRIRRYLDRQTYVTDVVSTKAVKSWHCVMSGEVCGRSVQKAYRSRSRRGGVAAGRLLLSMAENFTLANGGVFQRPCIYLTSPSGRRTTWRKGDE